MTPEKTVILVAGPTAVGKTAMAIHLARSLEGAPIISADSRQCYRELNIGVARPSPTELEQAKHYFVATHSVQETVNAATFEEYALKTVDNIFRHRDVAIISGGTGLYIKAFLEGLDVIPPIPAAVRDAIREKYQQSGLEWVQAELQRADPEGYRRLESQNPHRLMRALEVVMATGQPIQQYQAGNAVPRNFRVIKIGLDLPRDTLYQRINTRVDRMMEEGLLEEVRTLLPFRHYNALDTVGYKELFDYLDGNINLDRAIDLIKQDSRHYAKRQLTWFRKDPGMVWFDPGAAEQVLIYVRAWLSDSGQQP